jgi:hypothetical protein
MGILKIGRTIEVGTSVVQRVVPGLDLSHEQGNHLPIYGPGRQTHRTAEGPGTREAIDRLKHAQILKDSAALVDAMVLNVGGFTELDFDPRSE